MLRVVNHCKTGSNQHVTTPMYKVWEHFLQIECLYFTYLYTKTCCVIEVQNFPSEGFFVCMQIDLNSSKMAGE